MPMPGPNKAGRVPAMLLIESFMFSKMLHTKWMLRNFGQMNEKQKSQRKVKEMLYALTK